MADGAPAIGRARGRSGVTASAVRWRRTGLALALGALLALVGLPLVELVGAAVAQGPEPVRESLTGDRTAAAVRGTALVASAATVLAVVLGAAAALVTERAAVPGRRWLRLGMLLPLVVPPFVSALSWAQAYGPAGLTDDLVGVALPGLFGPLGIVAVLTVEAVPLAYLAIVAGLATRSEPDAERAARASGASVAETLRTVTLPLLRPSILAGAALVFVGTVNAFGVPAVLGSPAGFRTVTTQIYADLAFAADPAAFSRVLVLATGLVVVTLAVVGAADIREGLGSLVLRTGAPAGAAISGRQVRWPAGVLWGYLALTTGGPLLAVLATAATRAVGLAPVPSNWTLAHFRDALAGARLDALVNSLGLAIGAATAAVLLGGLLSALRRGRGARGLGTAAIVTFAVPGSALAVAVLLAYGSWLRDTLALIGIAYLGKFWALAHRPITAAADGLPGDCGRAARASGADPLTALRTVTLPLLRPALLAAWLLVFLFALHELTMSSLLYGPGSATLAVVVLNLQALGDIAATSALAVLLTAAVVVAAALLLLVQGARGR